MSAQSSLVEVCFEINRAALIMAVKLVNGLIFAMAIICG